MFSVLWNAIHGIIAYTSQSLLVVTLFLSVAYSFGWIHRFIWYMAETECQKLLNGTQVTCGYLQVDLLRGRAWASNVVIHAPRRDQWKWESPILARVGKVYVECNLVLCLLSLWFLFEEIPVDIYTIDVSDIQFFVERRQTFFNFFLLDPHVELPDPRDIGIVESASSASDDDDDENENNDNDNASSSFSPNNNNNNNKNSPDSVRRRRRRHHQQQDGLNIDTSLASWDEGNNDDGNDDDDDGTDECLSPAEEKAQQLMSDMFRAISRAAQEGSIQGALVEHRQKITSKLKEIQTTKKSAAMQEGVKIVQHVSKAVVTKTQTVQQVVQPVRKQLANEKDVYTRVGRIMIRDARVFTRDHFDTSAAAAAAAAASDSNTNSNGKNATKLSSSSSSSSSSAHWNKPIVIQQVAVRASELCPPLSATDDDGLPELYQSFDKVIEVVWKRLLAEGAKSDTGFLFKAAMGEVLDYWMEKDVHADS